MLDTLFLLVLSLGGLPFMKLRVVTQFNASKKRVGLIKARWPHRENQSVLKPALLLEGQKRRGYT